MLKKTVSLFTLAAFLLFEMSCVTVRSVKREPGGLLDPVEDQGAEIAGILTKSGEEIIFAKGRYGWVAGDRITGTVLDPKGSELTIMRTDISKIEKEAGGTIIGIVVKEGNEYRRYAIGRNEDFTLVKEEPDRYILLSPGIKRISVPLTDVDMVTVRRVDGTGSFFASLGVIALVYLAATGIALLLKESCPFIYSYDGKEFVFDAEPYGGAVCEGLKRTEWCRLENLKETDGDYKLRVTNEVNETQYTDELKLTVVDHPPRLRVIPDETGRLHTVGDLILPIRAAGAAGKNVLSRVSKDDWIAWMTPEEEMTPDRTDMKEELVFEFPKPAGARSVKFLFNGCNTLWGSQMVKRLLELNGDAVQDFYAKVNAGGPALLQASGWMLREELFRLRLQVDAGGTWKTKALIQGGGPFISESRLYLLDVSDIAGETLKIKLTPPASFWMINQVAVDYSADFPVEAVEIQAGRAADSCGRDIRDSLSTTDGSYFAMPETGDKADLIFTAPPRRPGMARTVFAKVSGYYDIHLAAQGAPRTDILEKMQAEAGYVVRYALEEYQKWKAEMAMAAARR